jgi:hypothetical protein
VDEYDAIVAVLNKYNECGAKADGRLAGSPVQGLYDRIDTAFHLSHSSRTQRARG